MSSVDRQRIERDGLVIRTFEPDDADVVWDLHIEGILDSSGADYERDPKWDEDVRDIPKRYLQPGFHFWVVEEDGRVIAMNAVRRHDDTTAEIKRMRVTEQRRRQGIARSLLEIAEDFCRDAGYTRIVLDTTDRQEAAKVMYANHGYAETSSRWIEPIQTTIRYYEKHLSERSAAQGS
jgi:GNAT superfamily N-acetyltransferase